MRRPFLPLMPPLMLLAVSLATAACNRGEAEPPPLRVDAIGDAATAALVSDAVSAGLTARDAGGRVVPGLAQSWRVADDGLSIVFRLREASFADGRRVRAADVIASLQRARSGRAGPLARDLMAGVTGVSAPLETVIEVRLSTPQPELLELLAIPALAVRPVGKAGSAGAFTVATSAENDAPDDIASGIRLVRNPGYFAAAEVALATATIRTGMGDAAVQRFNRGETDLVLGGELDGLGTARVTARRETLRLEPSRAAMALLVNAKRKPLDRLGVRTALQLAVNRNSLGPALFGSQAAAPLLGLVPPAVTAHVAAAPDWAGLPLVARQEEARRLLAEADVEAVEGRLKLAVAIGDSPGDSRLMAAVAADLSAIGIDLVLMRRTAQEHERAVGRGDFDLALVRRASPINSPLAFLLPLRCNANRHGACLPEADRLLAESWSAPTLAERRAALSAAERLWAADASVIGLVQPLDWSLVSPAVTGFLANAGGAHGLRHLALAPERKLLK